MIYWMTGLSGSGKTTIAKGVQALTTIEVLEGDDLRKGLCNDLGYNCEDRNENLRRIAHIATHLNKYTDVIVSCITPYETTRSMIRSICPDFKILYIKASIEECIRRDPKGLYKKVYVGQIANFTGISDVFEPPVLFELVVDTEKETPQESIKKTLCFIRRDNHKYAVFVGRWQPLHRGHEQIIRKQLQAGKKVAIAVRDTPLSKDNPFPLPFRIEVIKAAFQKEIISENLVVFPFVDIESINVGREVGYKVNHLHVPEDAELINATQIRELMMKNGEWKRLVPFGAIDILEKGKEYLTDRRACLSD